MGDTLGDIQPPPADEPLKAADAQPPAVVAPRTLDDLEPEQLLEGAKLKQQDYFDRKELEWKLAISCWSAIGLFTLTFFTDKIKVQEVYSPILLITLGVVYLAALGFYGWLQYLIQIAHRRDKQIYFDAMACLGFSDVERGTYYPFQWKWFLAHVGITAVFLAMSFFLIVLRTT